MEVGLSESGKSQSEKFPSIGKLGLLWKAWTVPVSASNFESYPEDDRKGARKWALAAIAFLTFALRGIHDPKSIVLAIAVAGSFGYALDMFARFLKDRLKESILISGFTTIAVLIFLVILTRVFASNYPLYRSLEFALSDIFYGGSVLAPIALALVPACLVWLVKAIFWDKNTVGVSEVFYSVVITLLGGCAVTVVSLMSDAVFARIFSSVSP